MSYITLKCKNCGSGMTLNTESKTITCNHCGSTFMLADVLDEKDVAFASKTSAKDIQTKMEIAKALKQGDTCVYQAEYKLAEEYYKKAIELDDKNYKGYFGVVRAKTSNFNRIPDSNDYLEYAKVVQKLVNTDDNVYVKSELAKLDLLKKEKQEQKIMQENNELKKMKTEANKRANEKFFAEITYFLILFLTAIILVCVFMTGKMSNDDPSGHAVTYEISSYEDLSNLVSQENYLSSTIILKKDIDFNGKNWTPIGTSNNPFTGKFYGNSYKISNMKIVDPKNEGNNFVGLFGCVKNATISGIKLDNVSLESNQTVLHQTKNIFGLICAKAENSTIKRCEVLSTSSIFVAHSNKSTFSVGGIVGETDNCLISMCYSNASISASVTEIESQKSSRYDYYLGGVVGSLTESNIINSYSKSTISVKLFSENEIQSKAYIAGIVGYYMPGISNYIKKCYFAGNIDYDSSLENQTLFIAGIVSYGATSSTLQSTYVLLTSNSFTLNKIPYDATTCHDNKLSNSSCEYITSEEKFTEAIIDMFPSSDWTNTSSLSPELI